MKKWVVFFWILGAMPAFCQKTKTDKVPAPETFSEFEIKEKKPASFPIQSFAFVRVLDARTDTSCLGIAVSNETLPRVKLKLKESTEDYLNRKLDHVIQITPSHDTLLIVLHDLWFAESRTRASFLKSLVAGDIINQANVYLRTSLYKIENGYYHFAGTMDTVLTENGWLLNNCHRLMSRTVEFLVQGSDSVCIRHGIRDEITPWNEIANERVKSNAYPILHATAPKKGIYHNYNDFRDNTPDTTIAFEAKEKVYTRAFRTFYMCQELSIDSSLQGKIWGFSDGINSYMYFDKFFFKLKKCDNRFDIQAPETIDLVNSYGGNLVVVTAPYYGYGILFTALLNLPSIFGQKYPRYNLKYYKLDLKSGLLW